MTGKLEKISRCPLCGGSLERGVATIPFVFRDTVVVVKNVPAEVCSSCHEPYTSGKVTDRLTSLINQIRALHAEVLVISYDDAQLAHTPIPA